MKRTGHVNVPVLFYIRIVKLKEGRKMEIAEIRKQLETMQEKITSFRGSL